MTKDIDHNVIFFEQPLRVKFKAMIIDKFIIVERNLH